jgi:hypothetical protein
VIDIFCITEQQQRVLVELQKGPNKRAIPRFLDYQCRNYSSQFVTGTDYKVVVPCYSICWFFDLQPPHTQIKETISLQSDCDKTDWKFDWQMIALYPRNIPPSHLKQQTPPPNPPHTPPPPAPPPRPRGGGGPPPPPRQTDSIIIANGRS